MRLLQHGELVGAEFLQVGGPHIVKCYSHAGLVHKLHALHSLGAYWHPMRRLAPRAWFRRWHDLLAQTWLVREELLTMQCSFQMRLTPLDSRNLRHLPRINHWAAKNIGLISVALSARASLLHVQRDDADAGARRQREPRGGSGHYVTTDDVVHASRRKAGSIHTSCSREICIGCQ